MAKTEVREFTLYNGEVKVKFYPNSHMYKVTDPKFGLDNQTVKGVTTYLGIKDKPALVHWAVETAGTYLLDLLDEGVQLTNQHVATAMNLHNEKKEEAGLIGQKTHDWCEYYIKHTLKTPGYEEPPTLPDDKETALGVDSFLEFITNNNVEFLASEKIVYSRIHQYIGLMDFKAMINGKLTVGDFKTSNGLYNTVFAQTAAYAQADEEEMIHSGNVALYQGMCAVRLAKETEQEYADRMHKKNAVRAIQGKEPKEIPLYDPFEVKFAEGRDIIESNFLGFMHCKNLHKWDADTDFYRNK